MILVPSSCSSTATLSVSCGGEPGALASVRLSVTLSGASGARPGMKVHFQNQTRCTCFCKAVSNPIGGIRCQTGHEGPLSESNLPIQGSPIWPVHSSNGVYYLGKRGQTYGSGEKYPDAPIPGRLVDPGKRQGHMFSGHPNSPGIVPGIGVGREPQKIGTGPQAGFQLIGLLTSTEKQVTSGRLHMRPIQWPKDTLAHPGVLGEDHPNSPIPSPPPAVVVKGGERSVRSTFAPPSSRGSDLYRRIKRRLGRTFRRLYRKRYLVSAGKQTSHQFSGIESSFASPKSLRTPLPQSGSPGCYGQYHRGSLHQQRRRHAFGVPMCPPVETPILVQSQGSLSESTAHRGPAQCDSRQTVPSPSGHSNGMVPSPGSIQSDLSQVAPSQTGPVCDKVQLQATPVCVPSPRSQDMGCGCLKPILGQSGSVCLSSGSSVDKYPDQSSQSSLQEDDNSSSGVAQHALVLGPGGNVLPNTDVPSKSPRSLDSAIQRQSSQGSTKPEPSCLAPRAKNIREQGFSDQVAKRIEAPQRRSTRSVYEAKWTVFVRWCKAHKVDFHSPSVEQIAEFLLHLFQEKKLQPSTTDGYRSAIADKVGNLTVNISRNENLNRLLDSFLDVGASIPGIYLWCSTS